MVKGFLPPGFRFHPTDVELVQYYLRRKVMGKPLHFEAIAVVDMYKFAPWDLPAESILKSRDLEWYFFCPRDRKYANGPRTNRATEIGYWKTTGKDRAICYNMRVVGMKKTLVFHTGRAPKGARTDWVMHEFRLEDKEVANAGFFLDAYVLCRIFEKSGPGPKNGEQYGAPFNEEEWDEDDDDVHDAQAPAPLLLPTSVNSCSPSLFPNLPNHFEVGSSSSAPPIGGNIDKTRENDTRPTSISDGDLSAFPEGYDLEKILMELNDSIDIPTVSLSAAIAENSSGCHGNILSEKSCTSQDGSEIFDGLGDITAHEELNRLYSLDSSFDENMLENPDMYGFLEVSDFVLPDLSKDGMHTMLPLPDGMATAAVADSEVTRCKEFSGFEANQGLTSSISLQEVENYENELQSLLDQELPFR